jgi:Zn-dependent M28 family amino/carboxypeptidase
VVPAAAQELRLPEGARAAASQIDADRLAAYVASFSRDELRGRGPGTEADAQARREIAQELTRLGYEPAGPKGQYEQRFGLVGVEAHMPATWTFRGAHDRVVFSWWDEYIAASGVQTEHVAIEDAEVVFVGYGIDAPEENWDDYGDADLTGKILLVLNDDPDWDENLFDGDRRLYYGRWTYKYEEAARRHAAGAIIVHTSESAGYPWSVVQTSWSGPQFALADDAEPRCAVHGWLTEDAARRLVALAGRDLAALQTLARDRDFQPIPLGVFTDLAFDDTLTRVETANVAGMLKGRDPVLSHEVVVYTAHHDHLGIGPADAQGDSIYNGARDNATGLAQLLGVARAFRALDDPPRRSILVLAVGAEEQGLLGSRYFAQHPLVPAEDLVADINFELGNIWGRTEDVEVVGGGKSTLADLLVQAAALQGRQVVAEHDPDAGFYYRSDQLSFARIGVPALWFRSGSRFRGRPEGWGLEQIQSWENEHYHQPSDEMRDSWNFAGMVEDAQLAFFVGLDVADAAERPQWRAGDEFRGLRRNENGVRSP